jgi:misacylated tRNA(Ala) deacylase
LYWEQPYVKSFQATVQSINDSRIILDKTLFYPGGGGVAYDTGKVQGYKLLETKKENDSIIHLLETPPTFNVGDLVNGELDWSRRYRLMKMHTAGHLLSSLFYNKANCRITGNQIDVDKSRMDFNMENFDRVQIQNYVDEANNLIRKGAQVKTYFMDREEALKMPELVKLAEAAPPMESHLRIVEIEGIDRQADGGLHVNNLTEIGRIQLLKLENKGKTNRRLYYTLE